MGVSCPPHPPSTPMPAAEQALQSLLHPSVAVMRFSESATAPDELLLSWRCPSRGEGSPWQPYHGPVFPTSFSYSLSSHRSGGYEQKC